MYVAVALTADHRYCSTWTATSAFACDHARPYGFPNNASARSVIMADGIRNDCVR